MTEEKKKRRSVVLGVRIDPETNEIVTEIAEAQDKWPSTVGYDALRSYIERMGRIPIENIKFEAKPHYAIIAPTDHGKTILVKEYVIPEFQKKKRIIVVDKHREYPFKEMEIKISDRITGRIGGDIHQMFEIQSLKPKINEWCEKITNSFEKVEEHISIRPIIPDTDVQNIFFSELFKRMCTVEWNQPILFIVEEAYFYDCRSLVSEGRHYNIQAFLISTQPLDTTVMDQCRLILGPITPFSLMEHNVDEIGATAAGTLDQFDFLWEKQKGIWRKMMFKPSFGRKKHKGLQNA